jgi:hypothetical protein
MDKVKELMKGIQSDNVEWMRDQARDSATLARHHYGRAEYIRDWANRSREFFSSQGLIYDRQYYASGWFFHMQWAIEETHRAMAYRTYADALERMALD